jgi:thiazole synthase
VNLKNGITMDKLKIAGKEFNSRLLLGTGKFSSHEAMRDAIAASGAEIVTIALRRVDLTTPDTDILSFIDRSKHLLLPNTSGSMNAKEAVMQARLAREAGLGDWVKLEVVPEPRYLFPDPIETLEAAKILIKDGFVVLPFINADPILAKKLEDIGCATVMPLGSPIGSNRGLRTRDAIRIIIEHATVPVVVDAGLGAPSHAAESIEMGADAVLVNTAIATANDPVRMAIAFKRGVEAGREAYLAGCPKQRETADASSPLTGFLYTTETQRFQR